MTTPSHKEIKWDTSEKKPGETTIYEKDGILHIEVVLPHKEEKCIAMWKPCSEDHNGNCYYCGRNMLSPTPDSMEKKPGAYDTFDMDDVKEGRVECVVGDPTDKRHAQIT